MKFYPEAIGYWREQRGLTTLDLARQAGYNRATVWRWENGRSTPTAVNLAALATVLEVSVAEFYAPGHG